MKMDLNQTKLVGLTMELDLKTREFKKLCNKLEQLKKEDIEPNDEKLSNLKILFQKNQEEIVQINKQLKEIKENGELIEKQNKEKYSYENLFKIKNNITKTDEKEELSLNLMSTKKNIFVRIIDKIKSFFIKK